MIYELSETTYNALCSMVNICKNEESLDWIFMLQQACVGEGDDPDRVCIVIENDCFVLEPHK